ncbi:MAG: CDP-diacylglycerol--glycerol-3-phosphate 3-phosphatidyltransferase [Candidatus Omnitrophota bacterium]|nr:CDP-diacylglycerol--glycerol-3-phosphate 3-phosphatidyltransferase [Candidatus Omnitrophota bacterium]
MNIPNKLTILRIALTVIFMFFLFMQGALCKIFAFITFFIAAFSDFLDGHIARKYNLVSDFGKFMDPIADKILVLSAFIAFVELGLVPAWMVMVIILREFTITGTRLMALRKNKIISAAVAGKHKTVSQIFAIFVILLFIIFREFFHASNFWNPAIENCFKLSIFILMFITVVFTLISGISFFARNRGLFE